MQKQLQLGTELQPDILGAISSNFTVGSCRWKKSNQNKKTYPKVWHSNSWDLFFSTHTGICNKTGLLASSTAAQKTSPTPRKKERASGALCPTPSANCWMHPPSSVIHLGKQFLTSGDRHDNVRPRLTKALKHKLTSHFLLTWLMHTGLKAKFRLKHYYYLRLMSIIRLNSKV